jgi:hypothetical protein
MKVSFTTHLHIPQYSIKHFLENVWNDSKHTFFTVLLRAGCIHKICPSACPKSKNHMDLI